MIISLLISATLSIALKSVMTATQLLLRNPASLSNNYSSVNISRDAYNLFIKYWLTKHGLGACKGHYISRGRKKFLVIYRAREISV
jgi:hypothetical protein